MERRQSQRGLVAKLRNSFDVRGDSKASSATARRSQDDSMLYTDAPHNHKTKKRVNSFHVQSSKNRLADLSQSVAVRPSVDPSFRPIEFFQSSLNNNNTSSSSHHNSARQQRCSDSTNNMFIKHSDSQSDYRTNKHDPKMNCTNQSDYRTGQFAGGLSDNQFVAAAAAAGQRLHAQDADDDSCRDSAYHSSYGSSASSSGLSSYLEVDGRRQWCSPVIRGPVNYRVHEKFPSWPAAQAASGVAAQGIMSGPCLWSDNSRTGLELGQHSRNTYVTGLNVAGDTDGPPSPRSARQYFEQVSSSGMQRQKSYRSNHELNSIANYQMQTGDMGRSPPPPPLPDTSPPHDLPQYHRQLSATHPAPVSHRLYYNTTTQTVESPEVFCPTPRLAPFSPAPANYFTSDPAPPLMPRQTRLSPRSSSSFVLTPGTDSTGVTVDDDVMQRLSDLPPSQTTMIRRLSQEFYRPNRSRSARVSASISDHHLDRPHDSVRNLGQVDLGQIKSRDIDRNIGQQREVGQLSHDIDNNTDEAISNFQRNRKYQMSLRKAFGIYDEYDSAETEPRSAMPSVTEDDAETDKLATPSAASKLATPSVDVQTMLSVSSGSSSSRQSLDLSRQSLHQTSPLPDPEESDSRRRLRDKSRSLPLNTTAPSFTLTDLPQDHLNKSCEVGGHYRLSVSTNDTPSSSLAPAAGPISPSPPTLPPRRYRADSHSGSSQPTTTQPGYHGEAQRTVTGDVDTFYAAELRRQAEHYQRTQALQQQQQQRYPSNAPAAMPTQQQPTILTSWTDGLERAGFDETSVANDNISVAKKRSARIDVLRRGSEAALPSHHGNRILPTVPAKELSSRRLSASALLLRQPVDFLADGDTSFWSNGGYHGNDDTATNGYGTPLSNEQQGRDDEIIVCRRSQLKLGQLAHDTAKMPGSVGNFEYSGKNPMSSYFHSKAQSSSSLSAHSPHQENTPLEKVSDGIYRERLVNTAIVPPTVRCPIEHSTQPNNPGTGTPQPNNTGPPPYLTANSVVSPRRTKSARSPQTLSPRDKEDENTQRYRRSLGDDVSLRHSTSTSDDNSPRSDDRDLKSPASSLLISDTSRAVGTNNSPRDNRDLKSPIKKTRSSPRYDRDLKSPEDREHNSPRDIRDFRSQEDVDHNSPRYNRDLKSHEERDYISPSNNSDLKSRDEGQRISPRDNKVLKSPIKRDHSLPRDNRDLKSQEERDQNSQRKGKATLAEADKVGSVVDVTKSSPGGENDLESTGEQSSSSVQVVNTPTNNDVIVTPTNNDVIVTPRFQRRVKSSAEREYYRCSELLMSRLNEQNYSGAMSDILLSPTQLRSPTHYMYSVLAVDPDEDGDEDMADLPDLLRQRLAARRQKHINTMHACPVTDCQQQLKPAAHRQVDVVGVLEQMLQCLRCQKSLIQQEVIENNQLALHVKSVAKSKLTGRESDKLESYLRDVDMVTSLLLRLSDMLARTDNSLACLPQDATDKQKSLLVLKRTELLSKHDDARLLRTDIECRSRSVVVALDQQLSSDEMTDYYYFILMKTQLAVELQDLDYITQLVDRQLTMLHAGGRSEC